MDKGWVKHHRQINQNVFLQKDNNAYIVFTKLLTNVSQKKGEWAGGRKQLAEITNINENTLKNVLDRLEKHQMITKQPNGRYTTYTICKWSLYQQTTDQTPHHRVTRDSPAGHHSIENKERRIKKGDLVFEEKNSRASEATKEAIRLQLRERGLKV